MSRVWIGTPLPGAQVLVVDGPRLPDDSMYDGWRVLLRVPGWEDKLLQLLGNPAVDKVETDRALEAIMAQQTSTCQSEATPLYKMLLDRGRQEGLQEGLQEGRQEGLRRAYLDLLAPLLAESEHARLAEHATTEELARRVRARLR